MTRLTRTLVTLLFSGSLLAAQIPNPLNLPDPLGLSKKPAPAPTAPREGRRVERKPKRGHRDQGKHSGKEKRGNRVSGGHQGHGKR